MKLLYTLKVILLTSIVLIAGLWPQDSFATHLRSAEISFTRVQSGTRTFRITVRAVTEPGNTVPFGFGVLDLGDGTVLSSPRELWEDNATDDNGNVIIESYTIQNIGEDATLVQFTLTHTYAAARTHIVGYREEFRNEGILNIPSSVDVAYYVESQISTDPLFGLNNSPVLTVLPTGRGATQSTFFHNPGAYDPDGDSLSYQIITPLQNEGVTVNGYRFPNDASFYDNFVTGNEAGNGSPSLEIDQVTGTLTWDAPGMAGEYNVSILIEEWRKVEGRFFKLGSIMRDMQIFIAEPTTNTRPDLRVPASLCVRPGTSINESITATDATARTIGLFAAGEGLEIEQAAIIDGIDNPANPITATIGWETDASLARVQPYQFIFRATAQHEEGPELSTVNNWQVGIREAAPLGISADTSLQATIDLVWEPYTAPNTDQIQIWRRENSLSQLPDSCATTPDNGGYKLVTTLPAGSTSFRDDNEGAGLIAGTNHCYRITASFTNNPARMSNISAEACAELGGVRPVITDVEDFFDENIDIKVFPNPTADILNIESIYRVTQLTILDGSGKLLHTIIVDADEVSMHTAWLAPGHYFLQISDTQANVKTVRFVKR